VGEAKEAALKRKIEDLEDQVETERRRATQLEEELAFARQSQISHANYEQWKMRRGLN